MMHFTPYMILLGGVDDYTLNLKKTCCKLNCGGIIPPSSAFDLTSAFKQRGMIAFGPKGNPCSPCGPPDVNKYRYFYVR